jgi:uroporphyrinogen decarboxylase
MKNQMTSRERVMTALNGGQPDRVPWLEAYVHPGLVTKLLGKKVAMVDGALFPHEIHEKLCLDHISYSMQAPVYAETRQSGDMNLIKTPWLKTRGDLEKLKKWLPDNTAESFYDNAKEYLKGKENYAALCILKIGLANTYNSMGYEDFVCNMYEDPEFIVECLEVWGEWCSQIIERINEMDYDIVQVAEDIAFQQGPMVKLDQYEKYIFPFCKKMIAKIKKPVIYHSDGDYNAFLPYILQYNVKGIANLEPPVMDIFKLKETYGKKVCLVGNIDLHYTLTMGTPEETIAEVKEKLEKVGKGGGYMITSSNGLTSYCKPENVLAMNDAILKYGWVK